MYPTELAVLSTALEAGTVPAKDVAFVSSLVSQSKTKGLSSSQWSWVSKMAARLAVASGAAPQRAVSSMKRVYSMFASAKQTLRYPKVHLHVGGGRVLKLYLSTTRSRVPNTVNVVDETTEKWYGRVHEDGKWEAGHASDEEMNSVAKYLEEFAENPEKVAAHSGHLSGACCFCNRTLTDDRSTSVGYGPVCARKFSLTWG